MFLQPCPRLSETSGIQRNSLSEILDAPPAVTSISVTNISRAPPLEYFVFACQKLQPETHHEKYCFRSKVSGASTDNVFNHCFIASHAGRWGFHGGGDCDEQGAKPSPPFDLSRLTSDGLQ
jgi:hypothetical protein